MKKTCRAAGFFISFRRTVAFPTQRHLPGGQTGAAALHLRKNFPRHVSGTRRGASGGRLRYESREKHLPRPPRSIRGCPGHEEGGSYRILPDGHFPGCRAVVPPAQWCLPDCHFPDSMNSTCRTVVFPVQQHLPEGQMGVAALRLQKQDFPRACSRCKIRRGRGRMRRGIEKGPTGWRVLYIS